MKRLISGLTLVVALFAGFACQAQTNSPQSFFQSVGLYFGAFNTNLADTFATDRLNVSIGSVTVGNSEMAADARFDFRLSTNSPFSLDACVRNTTVAGTVLSYQGGVGYSIVKVDTKLTIYLDGGYKTDVNQPYAAPGIKVSKALTANTFAGVGIELPIYFRNSPIGGNQPVAPTYYIFSGFRL